MSDHDKLLQEAINLWGEWACRPGGPRGLGEDGSDILWFGKTDQGQWVVSVSDQWWLHLTLAAHLIIGWAHDELVRRGLSVEETDYAPLYEAGHVKWRCVLVVTKRKGRQYVFDGHTHPNEDTMLHRYLAAIKATEDK